MGIVWTILIGFVVGVIAKLIHPGKENMGFVMTVILGIAGSFIATFVGQVVGFYRPGHPAGFLASVVGAVVLLVLYGRFARK